MFIFYVCVIFLFQFYVLCTFCDLEDLIVYVVSLIRTHVPANTSCRIQFPQSLLDFVYKKTKNIYECLVPIATFG